MRVALSGLTMAEYFRDKEGQDVLLFIDNIFRFTQAGSEVSALLGRMAFPTKLRPLGVAESMIEELRHLPEGHSTGYGSIWRAKKGSVLAIVPVGWVHGFRMGSRPDRSRWKDCIRGMLEEFRNLLKRPKTMVQINGRSCPVVGVVGSLHCAVDVTGLDCKIGDKVLLPVNPMYVKNMEVEFR